MNLTRVTRILALIGLVIFSACNDAPTAADTPVVDPSINNGGSYGSGGRAADSTSPPSTDAPSGNGGSYGSGG